MARLTDEKIREIALKYSLDICQSNPMRDFNQTELIEILLDAQIAEDNKRVAELEADREMMC